MSHQNFRNWISALEEPRAAQSKFSLWSTGQLNHQPPRLHQAQAIHTAHNLCGLVVVRSFDFTFTPDTCRFYSIPKSLGMAIPKLEKALMAPLVIDVRSPYPCGYGKKTSKIHCCSNQICWLFCVCSSPHMENHRFLPISRYKHPQLFSGNPHGYTLLNMPR